MTDKVQKQLRDNAESVPGAGKPRLITPARANPTQGGVRQSNSALPKNAASVPGAGKDRVAAPVSLTGVARARTLRSANPGLRARMQRNPSGTPPRLAPTMRRGGTEVPQDPQGHDPAPAPSSSAASKPGANKPRLNTPGTVLR